MGEGVGPLEGLPESGQVSKYERNNSRLWTSRLCPSLCRFGILKEQVEGGKGF